MVYTIQSRFLSIKVSMDTYNDSNIQINNK